MGMIQPCLESGIWEVSPDFISLLGFLFTSFNNVFLFLGVVPTRDDFHTKKFYAKRDTILREEGHDWSKPMTQGPWDIGFTTSYITAGGIQSPPYAFIRNNTLDLAGTSIKYWDEGNYSMPEGISVIKTSGEGSDTWDSSAYNMILVNETKLFLDEHVGTESKPFFTYIALGAAHLPNTPPYRFLDNSPIAYQYETRHMDILYEMDKVVGELTKALDERNMLEDTIIIFTSDNGGLNNQDTSSGDHDHMSNGPLRGSKGSLYEGGIRVPMTFRWDNGGIPKGERRSNMIGLNDLYKTICGLIGLEVPSNQAVDSMNFANYLLDGRKKAGLRKWYGAWMYDQSRLILETMRFKEMKLVRSFQNNTFELYNLTADVSESRDIASENQGIVSDIFRKLRYEGPCYDRYGKFKVESTVKRRSNVYKSCYWFRQKRTGKRCKKFPEAFHQCRASCAGQNSQYCAKDLYTEEKLFKIFSNTY